MTAAVETKVCNDCRKEKAVTDFDKRTDRDNRPSPYCKPCRKLRQNAHNGLPDARAKNIQRGTIYHQAHRLRLAAACKQWRDKIRDLYGVSYNTLHKRQSVQHRLRQNIRKRLYGSLIGGLRTPDLLGCSLDELKAHLESRFSDGMSWDNYGAWEIDHIRPLSAFDLTDLAQLRGACHFLNLQPLWKADNRRKAAKDVVSAASED